MPKARDIEKDLDPESTDERPRRDPRRFYALIIGCNVALAVVIACIVFMARGKGDAPEVVAPAPIDVLQTMAKADELQLTGRPDQAMELYRLASGATSSPPASLVYRLAVCAEQLGKLDDALSHYKNQVGVDVREHSFAFRLGQARVHYQKGNLEQCHKSLASMAIVSATPAYASTLIGRDVDYFFAIARSSDALDDLPDSRLEVGHIVKSDVSFSIDHILGLLPLEGNQLARQRPIGDDTESGVQIHGAVRDPSTTLVTANFRNQPGSVCLDALAAATSWKISVSEIASEVISAKRVEMHLRDKSAGEVLSLMLEPQRLFWTYEGDTLVIDRLDNVSSQVVSARLRQRANDLLMNALAEAPDHLLAPQAYLALGNLAALEGRAERAATFYREIIERFPRHEILQPANFNLAKTSYLNRDVASAIESFYNVVDGRRGSELEPLSYLFLGRIYFDQGDVKKARKELSRSLGLATGQDISATAALTLASAYLVNRDVGSAGSANAVLMENREALQDEPFRNRAIFLSTLTRFRATEQPSDMRRRGQELVAAAMKVDPSSFFGDFGYLLVGDAFADLNVAEETVRMYQQGLGRMLAAPMRDELLYRLAKEYRKHNRQEMATNALLELTAGSSETLAPKAAIELADLLHKTSDIRGCIHHCRWSLEQGYPEQHNVELLRMLGQVYEELGDHESAGFCFAGFLPSNVPRIAGARK